MQENEVGRMEIGFYFITDRNLSVNGIIQDVKDALEAGARMIQYREKGLSTREMYEKGLEIKKLCEKYGAKYIVNDRIDIAQATSADGVHIGQDDMLLELARKLMPDAVVGVSCSNVTEAVEAVKGGADYLGVGPIYPTSTKKDAGRPIGAEGVRKIRENVGIPIVAIGGITVEKVKELIKAGADSVSAISATVGPRTGENVTRFVEEIRKWRK
ncbi:MAG: thiamine phosphate synthase [Candidatus Heimdallarchaeaceae archaeon]